MRGIQSMWVQNQGKPGIILSLIACVILISGCQNKYKWSSSRSATAVSEDKKTPNTPSVSPAAVPQPDAETSGVTPAERSRIGLCQSELASLQKINPAAYAAKKASFDNLVSNASIYTSVRSNINMQTKDTLDALYKYKTNQMCGEIQRAVMEGLIRRGESVK